MSKSRPRFLAPGGGYKSRPLRELPVVADDDQAREEAERVRAATSIRDEPECIGPAILASYAEVNQRICTQQHVLDVANARQTRPQLQAEDRLKDVHRRAKYAHVDLSHEIHIMRRDLDRARIQDRPAPKRTLDRLERVEALLDGIAA